MQGATGITVNTSVPGGSFKEKWTCLVNECSICPFCFYCYVNILLLEKSSQTLFDLRDNHFLLLKMKTAKFVFQCSGAKRKSSPIHTVCVNMIRLVVRCGLRCGGGMMAVFSLLQCVDRHVFVTTDVVPLYRESPPPTEQTRPQGVSLMPVVNVQITL